MVNKTTLADKRAEGVIFASIIIGIILYLLTPASWSGDLRAIPFLLSLAVGYLSAYHSERSKQLWDIVFATWKLIWEKLTSLFTRNI